MLSLFDFFPRRLVERVEAVKSARSVSVELRVIRKCFYLWICSMVSIAVEEKQTMLREIWRRSFRIWIISHTNRHASTSEECYICLNKRCIALLRACNRIWPTWRKCCAKQVSVLQWIYSRKKRKNNCDIRCAYLSRVCSRRRSFWSRPPEWPSSSPMMKPTCEIYSINQYLFGQTLERCLNWQPTVELYHKWMCQWQVVSESDWTKLYILKKLNCNLIIVLLFRTGFSVPLGIHRGRCGSEAQEMWRVHPPYPRDGNLVPAKHFKIIIETERTLSIYYPVNQNSQTNIYKIIPAPFAKSTKH